MFDEREYRLALGFANGNPNVIADIGNALAKATTDAPVMRGNNPLSFVFFSHAIAEVDETTYKRLVHYHSGKKANHLIKWNGRCFVVGEEAYSVNPTFDPVRGRAKYERAYYGILFLRLLLDLFGDALPATINAFVAHPPADIEHSRALMKAVNGSWRFESNGQRYETTVEYVNCFDEIVGGVFNATMGVDGKPIDDVGQLMGDGPTLVFDLGGGSLDLARLTKEGAVDYNRKMVSKRVGVNTAVNTFKNLFDDKYRELVSGDEDGIDRSVVIDIFMDKDHTHRTGGETLECADLYEMAVNPVIREARAAVRDFAGSMSAYNRVLLTGGGSGLMFDEICTTLFPKFLKNNVIHSADHRRELFKANPKGAKKMIEVLKQESTKRANVYRKARG